MSTKFKSGELINAIVDPSNIKLPIVICLFINKTAPKNNESICRTVKNPFIIEFLKIFRSFNEVFSLIFFIKIASNLFFKLPSSWLFILNSQFEKIRSNSSNRFNSFEIILMYLFLILLLVQIANNNNINDDEITNSIASLLIKNKIINEDRKEIILANQKVKKPVLYCAICSIVKKVCIYSDLLILLICNCFPFINLSLNKFVILILFEFTNLWLIFCWSQEASIFIVANQEKTINRIIKRFFSWSEKIASKINFE